MLNLSPISASSSVIDKYRWWLIQSVVGYGIFQYFIWGFGFGMGIPIGLFLFIYSKPDAVKAVCGIIRSTTKQLFAEYIGKFQIQSMELDSLSLGTLPPKLYGFKVHDTNENGWYQKLRSDGLGTPT